MQYTVLPPPRNLRHAWVYVEWDTGPQGAVSDRGMILQACAVLAVRVDSRDPTAIAEYLVQPLEGGQSQSYWTARRWIYFDEMVARKFHPKAVLQ